VEISTVPALLLCFVTVDVDLGDEEKVKERFVEEDFDEQLGSPTEVKCLHTPDS